MATSNITITCDGEYHDMGLDTETQYIVSCLSHGFEWIIYEETPTTSIEGHIQTSRTNWMGTLADGEALYIKIGNSGSTGSCVVTVTEVSGD